MARRVARLAAVLLGVPLALPAGIAWVPLGPPGGDLDFVASAPSRPQTVYASSAIGGVFASGDSGATWRPANSGLTDLRIRCLAVSPADPGVVYAGAVSGGFRTTDGGASWTPLSGGFPSSLIDAIAIDPADPSTVYAAGTEGALVRSRDAGATWAAIGNAATTAGEPRLLAVDPSDSSRLYLATLAGGVFRSSDGGDSWTASTSGLKDSAGNVLAVTAVAVDPTNGARLYAGTVQNGVFASADAGATWTAANDGAGDTLTAGLLLASDGTAYLAQQVDGLFSRAPGSGAWSPIFTPVRYINAIAFGPAAGASLYFAFGNSPVGGGGLGLLAGGATELRDVAALAVVVLEPDPATPGRVLASTTNGAYEWAPATRGSAWTALALDNGFERAPLPPASILFDPRRAGLVYFGTSGLIDVSTDGGRTIAYTSFVGDPFLPPAPIWSLLPQPGSDRGVYAGTARGLFQSSDGVIWSAGSTDLSARQVLALGADPSAPATLWAGTDDGVYRSADGGAHWARTGASLSGAVHAVLAPSGGAAGRVFAAADAGLFVTTNGGATWTTVPGVAVPADALARDAGSGALAAGTAVGVFESTDGGASWVAANEGLANPRVLSVAYLPGRGLLAGTNGGSVFERIRSEARGPAAPAARPGGPRTIPSRP